MEIFETPPSQLTSKPKFWAIEPATFTVAECDRLVAAYLPAARHAGALAGGGRHDNIRRCEVAWVADAPENEWLYGRIAELAAVLNRDGFQYRLDGMDEQLLFISYQAEVEGFYDWHVDRSGNGLGGRRKLSISIQLSDGDTYDGGDLLLNAEGFALAAPRQKGCAIAFPSYCLHRVNPVTGGTRHALVVWLHGPDFT